MLVQSGVERKVRAQHLGNRESVTFHAPGSEVLTHRRDANIFSKASFQSGVGACGEILTNGRTKQQVSSVVARQERGFPPRTPHSEIDFARKITRVQTLFRERT